MSVFYSHATVKTEICKLFLTAKCYLHTFDIVKVVFKDEENMRKETTDH